MRFTFVVIKEHAGRPVHLGHDHTLGAVNHKCAVRRHQGHIAHEHILLFDVFDRFRTGIFVHIKDDQA